MADSYRVELTPEAVAVMGRLKDPTPMLAAVAKALDEENAYSVSHIQKEYLSFPKDGPAVAIGLRAVSNSYRRSLFAAPATMEGGRLVSSIGSNVTNRGVSYPAVHEFGATIPPHKITAKGKALRFMIGDRLVFRKSVNHPGAVLPARRPIQRGLEDRTQDYRESVSAAIVNCWEG